MSKKGQPAFSRYTCWDPSDSNSIIQTDAVMPSDAVFLATHQPMTLIRRPMRGQSEGTYVTESDVLEQFLKTDEPMMLLPILGGSGTGKSHLVRWIAAQLGESSEERRIVYVPKHGTSLRKVIELILDQMEGDDVAALREELDNAVSKLNEEVAPSAVLAALADAVEFGDQRRIDAEQEDQTRSVLRETLPDLLRDPLFRKQFFLIEGGTIRTFVDRAMKGNRPGDSDDAFEFTKESMADITRINSAEASKTARDAKQHLTLPTYQEAAAQLLTENLGPAIQAVLGLQGSVSLSDVMLQTREVLAERGSELILLIEDFTMLQGVQRELLDAIVEPPTRSGASPLCGIRVTLAVTPGYWDTLADTVRTRAAFASYVYDLNVPVDETDRGPMESVPLMVGRYLNAVRLGRERLDQSYSGELDGDWIPNACDECDFRNECHEAFGAVDGWGLYPLNKTAVWRTTRAVLESNFIDPRAILGSVVKDTLENYHVEIEEGQFPSSDYEAAFDNPSHPQRRLPAEVVYELNKFPDPQRRKALLTIWADAPNTLHDLQPGIHEAFDLPLTGLEYVEEHATPSGPAVVDAADVSLTPPDATQRIAREIEQIRDWAAGSGILPEGLSRALRQHLADALWNSIDWDSELLKRGSQERDKVLTQASFEIEDAAGGRQPGKDMWTRQLPRSDEMALLFTGIFVNTQTKNWAFQGGPPALRIRLALLDEWKTDFLQHLRRVSGIESVGEETDLIERLLAGACVLGSSRSRSSHLPDLLAAAFEPVKGFPIEDVFNRQDKLSLFAREAHEKREEMQQVLLANLSARQGGGGVHAIDTSKLVPALEAIIRDPSQLIDNASVEAMKREIEDVRSTGEQIRAHLNPKDDAQEVADVVSASISTAMEIGAFYPGSEGPVWKDTAQKYSDFDLGILNPAYEDNSVIEEDPRGTLVWLAQDPGTPLKEYLRHLDEVSTKLEDCVDRARQGGKSSGIGEALKVLESEIGRVRDILDRGE